MKINKLGAFRYSVTTFSNGKGIYAYSQKLAIDSLRITMAITYENLIAEHTKNLQNNIGTTRNDQVTRNHMTAIRGFMRHLQKSQTSPIGDEFGSGFDTLVLEHIDNANLSDRSKRDRRSLLNLWRDTFVVISASQSVQTKRERRSAATLPFHMTPFEKKLREGLQAAKLTPKRAAKMAGIGTSSISRWTRGAIPNVRTAATLFRLDETLGFPPGTLNSALQATNSPGQEAKSKNAYRQRLKTNTKSPYVLRDVLPMMMREWKDYLRYKTAPAPQLRRSSKAKWSTQLRAHSCLRPEWFCSVGQSVCPSADLSWSHVSGFLGYLQLSVEKNGFGLSTEQAQTLAWFAVPEAIEGYFAFKTNRSDGLKHGGQAEFCKIATTLLHQENGYLAQLPDMASRLPEEYRPDTGQWTAMCEQARLTALALKSECHDKSRNPAEPIEPLLALEDPLSPIFDAMRRLRAKGDAARTGSKDEASARRDELLFGFLVFNPLRLNNIITLTYRKDGSGDIFSDSAGVWTIRLSAGRMKNRGRLKNQIYTVRLPEWLGQLVDDYVKYHRHTLCKGNECDNLFLSNNGTRFDGLSGHFLNLTKRHIPICSGFGPHTMRHLVATNWLMKNPNDFWTVAEILNDTLEVVMNNYAHLKKDTAFSRYNSYLENFASL